MSRNEIIEKNVAGYDPNGLAVAIDAWEIHTDNLADDFGHV